MRLPCLRYYVDLEVFMFTLPTKLSNDELNRTRVARFSLLLAISVLALLLLGLLPKENTVRAGENIWSWANVGGYVDQIVTDPLNPSTVYAVIGDGRLVKSTDGGSTWSNIADPEWNYVGHVSVAFGAPNVLYVKTNSGIHRSTDGGATWQSVYPARRVTGVAVSPVDWREAYLADSSYVGLTLSATDDLSGVGEMLISSQEGFAGAEWEAYVAEKAWWVADTGITTIRVKYRDRAGNESDVFADSVTP
jgi:hypothetical protein